MNIEAWLAKATEKLRGAGVGTARLDALVLLEGVLSKDRAHLLAHPEHKLSSSQVAKLTKLLNRRAEHQPLAYVRGKTEFYGREFIISPAVLEPRPESETMIDMLKSLLEDYKVRPFNKRTDLIVRIADVGAGSGAIGITAALELPQASVELLEIDKKALQIAKINVDKYTMNIPALESDLLGESDTNYHVLLCNLPYIPNDYVVNKAALQEPKIAVFGGPDGLDVYRKLFNQLAKRSSQPLYILTESLPPQHELLQVIANRSDYRVVKTDDFIQLFERFKN